MCAGLAHLFNCVCSHLNSTVDVNKTTELFIAYKEDTDEANDYDVFSEPFQELINMTQANITAITEFPILNTSLWNLNASRCNCTGCVYCC